MEGEEHSIRAVDESWKSTRSKKRSCRPELRDPWRNLGCAESDFGFQIALDERNLIRHGAHLVQEKVASCLLRFSEGEALGALGVS